MKYLLPLFLLVVQLMVAQDNSTGNQITVTDAQGNVIEQVSFPAMQNTDGFQFVYVTAGNMTGSLSDFERFFRDYLITEHEIGYHVLGCMLMGPDAGYMTARNKEIETEFGKNFINEERAKAKELFEKRV